MIREENRAEATTIGRHQARPSTPPDSQPTNHEPGGCQYVANARQPPCCLAAEKLGERPRAVRPNHPGSKLKEPQTLSNVHQVNEAMQHDEQANNQFEQGILLSGSPGQRSSVPAHRPFPSGKHCGLGSVRLAELAQDITPARLSRYRSSPSEIGIIPQAGSRLISSPLSEEHHFSLARSACGARMAPRPRPAVRLEIGFDNHPNESSAALVCQPR